MSQISTMSTRRPWFLVAGLTLVCGFLVLTSLIKDEVPDAFTAHGVPALPNSSVEDWVTYGDYVAEVSVDSESRIPALPSEVKRGEGLIERSVSLSVSNVVWARPTLASSVPSPPPEIDVLNGGWVFHGNEEGRLVVDGDPWMEVGSTRIAVLTYGRLHGGDPSWFLLAQTSLRSGMVSSTEPEALPAASSLSGKSVKQLKTALRSTEPNSQAAGDMKVDPLVRWERASAEPTPIRKR